MEGRFVKAVMVIFLTIGTIYSYGQDIHFSQFNASPLTLNPALAGVNGCGYRFAANYRSQWANVANYQTVAASYDMALGKVSYKKNYGGIGLSLVNDVAGDIRFRTTQINLSASYTIVLNQSGTSTLTGGIEGGIGNRGFDRSRITTDAQFGVDGFDISAPTLENITSSTLWYPDLGFGLLFNRTAGDRTNFYGGFALAHFNQPNVSFLDGAEDLLKMKMTLHGGGYFGFSEQLGILPSFMFLRQGNQWQLNIGSLVKIKKSPIPSEKMAFYVGGWYRASGGVVGDAIIFSGRLDVGSLNIGFSYDMNISSLSAATNLNGGPEISLIYTGCLKKGKNYSGICPLL